MWISFLGFITISKWALLEFSSLLLNIKAPRDYSILHLGFNNLIVSLRFILNAIEFNFVGLQACSIMSYICILWEDLLGVSYLMAGCWDHRRTNKWLILRYQGVYLFGSNNLFILINFNLGFILYLFWYFICSLLGYDFGRWMLSLIHLFIMRLVKIRRIFIILYIHSPWRNAIIIV